MSDVIIKICGLTHPEDVRCAVEAGATHVGFIFAPARRRTVDPSLWLDLMDATGNAKRVGVFQGNEPDELLQIAELWALSVIQLHGGYSAQDVACCARRSGLPVWWAQQPLLQGQRFIVPTPPEDTSLVVLDSAHAGQFGGTGEALPWHQIDIPLFPFLVAGGLSSSNVADVIRLLRPAGVDTSSGVEDLMRQPRKSHDAIRAFVTAARNALVSRETNHEIDQPPADPLSGPSGENPW